MAKYRWIRVMTFSVLVFVSLFYWSTPYSVLAQFNDSSLSSSTVRQSACGCPWGCNENPPNVGVTCKPDQVYVASNNTCAAKADCASDQAYIEYDNTCQVKAVCTSSQFYFAGNNTCDDKAVCASNEFYVASNNTCVDKLVCTSNEFYVAGTNTCVPKLVCTSSQFYDSSTNTCVPKLVCTSSQFYDSNTNTCVAKVVCDNISEDYDAATNQCMAKPLLSGKVTECNTTTRALNLPFQDAFLKSADGKWGSRDFEFSIYLGGEPASCYPYQFLLSCVQPPPGSFTFPMIVEEIHKYPDGTEKTYSFTFDGAGCHAASQVPVDPNTGGDDDNPVLPPPPVCSEPPCPP